ncbi:hydroxyproline-rich glycoprotein family protein [Striga asiatica]|uniref:Hydroxyproline-rich glycoprotein family protein n=1 Tax=Striga asiatica TaxID=4170 RepID=A0A5A7PQN5_STRAF|nr:hydroxyproline-rich glycoprotein family protein [Striga asiatica]
MARSKRKASYRRLILDNTEDIDDFESMEKETTTPLATKNTAGCSKAESVLGLPISKGKLTNEDNVVDDLVNMGFDVEMLEGVEGNQEIATSEGKKDTHKKAEEDTLKVNAHEKKKAKTTKEDEKNEHMCQGSNSKQDSTKEENKEENPCPMEIASSSNTGPTNPGGDKPEVTPDDDGFSEI